MPRRFLTLFPRLKQQYLAKDVGSIPYHLAQSYGWSSSVAYLAEEEGHCIQAASYQEHVQIITMGTRKSTVSNALTILRFLIRNSRSIDVLNLYHESLNSILFGVIYKLCNPNGVVYIKLDVGKPFLEKYRRERDTFYGRIWQYFRYRLSAFSVALYSAETQWAYSILARDEYFAGRIMLLANGICFQDFDYGTVGGDKENIILYVGNIGAYAKNCELLVEAVADLNNHILENWKLYLVGPTVNADCYETGEFHADDGFNCFLEDLYQKQPLMKNVVVMPGQIDDRRVLSEIYSKAKIFCMPSRYESFGFVLLEAMYFSNYLISTDLPLIADLMGKGAVGRVVPTDDRSEITAAIENSIDEWDRSIACRLHGNRKIVVENYDWTEITGLLDTRLQQLMNNGK